MQQTAGKPLPHLCGELYQILGALGAPSHVLAQVSMAARGVPVDRTPLLPFNTPKDARDSLLDAPAFIGGMVIGAGVPEKAVVQIAQQQYQSLAEGMPAWWQPPCAWRNEETGEMIWADNDMHPGPEWPPLFKCPQEAAAPREDQLAQTLRVIAANAAESPEWIDRRVRRRATMKWIALAERMPNPEEHDRVLIYTQGRDFAGEQVFDVKAETLNECMYEDPEDQPEVCRCATHWSERPAF